MWTKLTITETFGWFNDPDSEPLKAVVAEILFRLTVRPDYDRDVDLDGFDFELNDNGYEAIISINAENDEFEIEIYDIGRDESIGFVAICLSDFEKVRASTHRGDI